MASTLTSIPMLPCFYDPPMMNSPPGMRTISAVVSGNTVSPACAWMGIMPEKRRLKIKI